MIQSGESLFPGVRTRKCQAFAGDSGVMGWNSYRPADREWFVGFGDFLFMTLKRGAVQPFHYHKKGTDTMAVISGSAHIVLYDMREDSPSKGQVQVVPLSLEGSEVAFLQVPPLVAHGFQGVSELAVLVDLASLEEQATTDFFFNEPGSVPYEFK
jgi:dTDP-4-dehydrorhamnose 3,5-epimerase